MVAGALLILQAALLAFSATRHSPTMQEAAQLAAGIANWEFGRFELYRVNPPLVRMIAALPVVAAGCETDWSRFEDEPGSRREFPVGADFVAANGPRTLWLITIARWACIPICSLGGLFCFWWARELVRRRTGSSGDWAGLLALALWCLDPNILAHGECINTDLAAATFGLGAAYAFWRWLTRPSWPGAIVAGALLGIAVLAKLSWLLLFGLWPAIWLIAACCPGVRDDTADPPGPPTRSAGLVQLVGLFAVALNAINLGYGFDGAFVPIGEYEFVSEALSGRPTGAPGNRARGTVFADWPVPLPEQFVIGLDLQRKDFESFAQPSYLRGTWREGGWWYYYLYGLAVKVPHGTQLLLVLALVAAIYCAACRRTHTRQRRIRRRRAADLLPLLAPPMALFLLVSAQLEFNHHLRYVLPCAGFLFVAVGALSAQRAVPARRRDGVINVKAEIFISCNTARGTLHSPTSETDTSFSGDPMLHSQHNGARRTQIVFAVALAWTATSTLAAYPHELAYFNEAAGGAPAGYRHLLVSNFDWDQDLLYLRDWQRRHPGARPLYVAAGSYYDARDLGIDCVPLTQGDVAGLQTHRIPPGWHVVSALYYQGFPRVVPPTWITELRKAGPDDRIGHTLFVFHRLGGSETDVENAFAQAQ